MFFSLRVRPSITLFTATVLAMPVAVVAFWFWRQVLCPEPAVVVSIVGGGVLGLFCAVCLCIGWAAHLFETICDPIGIAIAGMFAGSFYLALVLTALPELGYYLADMQVLTEWGSRFWG